MPSKREKKVEKGAPAWMVTYGDMVTLLLTFFVLLLSMSELKKEERLITFIDAIKQAFGYRGGMKMIPAETTVEMPKNVELSQTLIIPIDPDDMGKSKDDSRVGRQDKVRPMRDAERFVIGSPIEFNTLSAELALSEVEELERIADQLRGFATQIEVRAHASPQPVDSAGFVDHADLAYARARAAVETLVEQGIDRRRIVIVAAGVNDPLAPSAYRAADQRRNDIVEVLQLNRRAERLE